MDTAECCCCISPGQYHSTVRAIETGTGPDSHPPIIINAHLISVY